MPKQLSHTSHNKTFLKTEKQKKIIIHNPTIFFLIYWFLEREEGGEKHRLVVLHIYTFIGWVFYVPWPEIEPTALVYQDNIPTNWATQPGPQSTYLS